MMLRFVSRFMGALLSICIGAIIAASAWGTATRGDIVVLHGLYNNNIDIYLHDIPQGITARLTQHPSVDAHPEWSPDGTRIAFASNRIGGGEIFIMDADGRHVVQVTDNPDLSYADPTWSPDGTQIAFVADGGRFQRDIYVLNFADGTTRNLTRAILLPAVAPRWSPDGDVIWMAVLDPGNLADRIYTVNPETLELIIHLDESDFAPSGANTPSPSPDGKQIAFTVSSSELWVQDHTVLHKIALPHFDTSRVLVRQPAWSPNGQSLSVLISIRNQWSLLLVDAATESFTQRTISLSNYSDLHWKPYNDN